MITLMFWDWYQVGALHSQHARSQSYWYFDVCYSVLRKILLWCSHWPELREERSVCIQSESDQPPLLFRASPSPHHYQQCTTRVGFKYSEFKKCKNNQDLVEKLYLLLLLCWCYILSILTAPGTWYWQPGGGGWAGSSLASSIQSTSGVICCYYNNTITHLTQ